MKSRGIVIFGSILAALQFLAGAAALADIIGKTPFALFVIGVGAVQVGWATYQQGVVVPTQDVAAYMNSSGNVVAGPAAGATNGTPVVVEPGTITADMVQGRHEAPIQDRIRDQMGYLSNSALTIWLVALSILVVLILFGVRFDRA